MKILIVVPARYGSSRFPGKPLADIAGRAMVSRVAARARAAAAALDHAEYVVATDDERIQDHCNQAGFNCVLTDADLASGSDRALAAAQARGAEPDVVVNLQGDAPFTPLAHITSPVQTLEETDAAVATPAIQLDWDALDALRAAKKDAPFSGTTVVVDGAGRALWFSKTILPAMRKEDALRASSSMSPVRRHVGLYVFRKAALQQFVSLAPGQYEQIEGLEQLRLIENGIGIACVDVEAPQVATSGVDTPDDLARLEARIAEHGDPDTPLFDNA